MMCSGCASPIGEWVRWGLRAAQGNPSFTMDPECLHWASPTESEAFQVFSYYHCCSKRDNPGYQHRVIVYCGLQSISIAHHLS